MTFKPQPKPEKKRAILKLSKAKKPTSSIKGPKRKADTNFSLYVRQRDADLNGMVRCCTCGTPHHWKRLHCGHFQSRRYESTRYDEKNTGPQCPSCNTFNQGQQYKFSLYLNGKYGPKTADQMTIKSRLFCGRKRYDYEVIAEDYKQKLKDLK